MNASLKEGSRGTGHGKTANRTRRTLIVAEVAISLILLAGAGLMIRSFQQLRAVDPGFRSESILSFNLLLPPAQYGEELTRIAFFDRLLQRLRALPGVESAAGMEALYVAGGSNYLTFDIEGRPAPPPGSGEDTQVRAVTPETHHALGLRLLRGRTFTEADSAEAPDVALINETFARRYFGDQDPLGRRVAYRYREGQPQWHEIVGVIGDVKQRGLDRDSYPEIQVPYAQDPSQGLTVLLRSTNEPVDLAAAARHEVQALDPSLPIYDVRTLESVVDDSVAARRFHMFLFALFAGLALLLAAVGIYGVLSHAVSQRTAEIGVRMAMGARPSDILRLVVGDGMILTLLGIGFGTVGALALSRLLATLLFQVQAHDPLTFVLVAAILAVVALLACYIPARRAARVDPMVALRSE